MEGHSLIGRRQLLKLLAAVGAGGAVGSDAVATVARPYQLPAGTFMIGCGGAGCKIVRRMIGLGFDPAGFVTIDSDQHDLSASGAARQILRPERECGRGLPDISEEGDHPEIDALLQQASKIVLVGGLAGGMGANWLSEIASLGGLAYPHIIERGLQVEVVAAMPRQDEPPREWRWANTILWSIRQLDLVKTHVDCGDPLVVVRASSRLEQELWLTRQALLCVGRARSVTRDVTSAPVQ